MKRPTVTKAQQADAIKLWRAQCDPCPQGESFEFERVGTSVFVEGTVWDGRRVTVQVRWEPNDEAFVWNGLKYRFCETEMRQLGTLVLVAR